MMDSTITIIVQHMLDNEQLSENENTVLKPLFHSSQARCENFHPVIIFESTRCELAFAMSGKEALFCPSLYLEENKMN